MLPVWLELVCQEYLLTLDSKVFPHRGRIMCVRVLECVVCVSVCVRVVTFRIQQYNADRKFLEVDDLSNSMGLFLQKTNIIRDYLEDINEKRIFWPRAVWYVTHRCSQHHRRYLLLFSSVCFFNNMHGNNILFSL